LLVKALAVICVDLHPQKFALLRFFMSKRGYFVSPYSEKAKKKTQADVDSGRQPTLAAFTKSFLVVVPKVPLAIARPAIPPKKAEPAFAAPVLAPLAALVLESVRFSSAMLVFFLLRSSFLFFFSFFFSLSRWKRKPKVLLVLLDVG
jgi:hypothetical protein